MKQILRIATASILCLFLSSCEFFRAQDVAAQPKPVIKQNAEEPKKEAEAAPQGLVILKKTRNNELGKAFNPSNYYVALGVQPIYTLAENEDKCFERNLLAFLRRIFAKDSGTLIVSLEFQNQLWVSEKQSNPLTIPIYSLNRAERKSGEKEQCWTTEVGAREQFPPEHGLYNGATKITPFLVAGPGRLQFRVVMRNSKKADIQAASKTIDALAAAFSLAGGSGHVIAKLASEPFQRAARKVDEFLGDEKSVDVMKSALIDFPHRPALINDPNAWVDFSDRYIIRAPVLIADTGGYSMSVDRELFSITLMFQPPIFTRMQSESDVLNTDLSQWVGPTRPKLAEMIQDSSLFHPDLVRVDSTSDPISLRNVCADLNAKLGFLASDDIFIARLAILKTRGYGQRQIPQDVDNCFTESDRGRLKRIAVESNNASLNEFGFTSYQHSSESGRLPDSDGRLGAILQVLKQGRESQIAGLAEEEGFLRISIRGAHEAVGVDKAKRDLIGKDAVDFFKGKTTSICNYQLKPGAGMSVRAAHMKYNGKIVGVAFRLENNGIAEIIIDTLDGMKTWLALTGEAAAWATETSRCT